MDANATKLFGELVDFYGPAPETDRPDTDGIKHMAEELSAAGLDLESASVDQLNRLARGETL